MGDVRAALAEAARVLEPVSATARLDAELLMAHALGCSREGMILARLGDAVPEAFAGLVTRRLTCEPVAYIIGTRGFWTIDLGVGPGVLVPRADSETLIQAAVAHFSGRSPATILDLGTGPGTLLLAALDEWPGASGLGIDRSEVAIGYARANAERLGMAGRARFATGDWAQGIDGRFDLVLANPPYIGSGETLMAEVRNHEPGEALFAGEDGLDAYRAIVPELARLLAPGGAAIVEIGARQGEAVTALVRAAGLEPQLRFDLGGNPRAILALER